MITFQDKIEMFQGLRRYDPATGEAVPASGGKVKELLQQGGLIEDASVETSITSENPSPVE